MNIKKIFGLDKAALLLSRVVRCFSRRKNRKTGQLMEIVKINGENYCAVAIDWSMPPMQCTITYKRVDDIRPEIIG